MSFKIQNLTLSLLAIVLIIFFTFLGYWQLSRAEEKNILIKSYAERTKSSALNIGDIREKSDYRFFTLTVQGEFDNDHTFLLDNKTYEGKIGYEVYTPFKATGLNQPILIDRGFIPIGKNRRELPFISSINGMTTVTGMLNFPPAYVSFGKLTDTEGSFPMRVEYIQLNELASELGIDAFFPYVLNLSANHPAAFAVKWQVVSMNPEKHTGYAIQWFAFALTLLIIFVALNRPTKK